MWPKVSRKTDRTVQVAKLHKYFVAQAALEDLRYNMLSLAETNNLDDIYGRLDQLNYKLFFMIVHVEEEDVNLF